MKKLLFAAAALLLLSSCDRFKVQVYEDDLTMALEEGSTDSLHLAISLEYVAGGLKPEALQAINNTIATQAFDLEEAGGSLEECAVKYRENLIDLYFNENEDGKGGFIGTWEDELDGVFMPDWDGKKNYALTYYSFRGGAHGIMTISYLVFDPKTGAQLTEKDLFKDGYREPVTALLQADLAHCLSAEEDDFLEMVNMDLVVPNGNFILDFEGITWVYQPYEIGPYALGALTAGATWEDLKPYLK